MNAKFVESIQARRIRVELSISYQKSEGKEEQKRSRRRAEKQEQFRTPVRNFIEAQTLVRKGRRFFWRGEKYRAVDGKLSCCFPLLSFSLFSFYFLGCQTPLEDDNSRDDWLNPLHP